MLSGLYLRKNNNITMTIVVIIVLVIVIVRIVRMEKIVSNDSQRGPVWAMTIVITARKT